MMQFGRGLMPYGAAVAFTPGLVVRPHGTASLGLRVQIANDAHIRRAWGPAIAEKIAAEMRRRLMAVLPGGCRVLCEGGGGLAVDFHLGEWPDDGVVDAMLPTWLGHLCAATLLDPVATDAGLICVWLSVDWSLEGQARARICPFQGAPMADGRDAEALYRADMQRVVAFLPSLMRSDDSVEAAFALHWQPVVDRSGGILFHEALCRPCDDDGAIQPPEPLLLALERLGFVSLLDQAVVSAVIDELEAVAEVSLAVNVSAQSLACAGSCSELCERLIRRPDVARRLVWEITETALASDMDQATAFIAVIKDMGCRVAVDDFGVGFASIRQLLIFSPDIIKIDRLFLERATQGGRDAVIFRQMVELARSFGAEVVVEGIETRAQADLVDAAGAVWQQGYFHARPSSAMPWRRNPDDRTACLVVRP